MARSEDYKEGYQAGYEDGFKQWQIKGFAGSGYLTGYTDACRMIKEKISSIIELAKQRELFDAVNKVIADMQHPDGSLG
ncbi:MAG: hypothetical protein ACYDHZ_03110 [Dehalococcoidia bacterium]